MRLFDRAKQISGVMDKMDLQNKVVLITGAGAGIGRELAHLLSLQGAKVALLDCNGADVEDLAQQLGVNAMAIAVDVTDRRAMRDAISKVKAHFGQLDVIVANAGVAPKTASIRTCDPADFDRVQQINVTGVFNTVQPAIDALIESQGHIVVVASAAAFCPPFGGAAYMVSKAAVEQLARGLRLELAPHGVTTTTAYFGIVETAMTRHSLDNDPIGQTMHQQLPAMLRRRITAKQAASTLVAGISTRKSRVVAPKAWIFYSQMRGLINPVIDAHLVRDEGIKDMLHAIEEHEKSELS